MSENSSTTVYMVVGILDEGGVQIKLGGGSSTPASARVYATRKQAERYWKDGQRCNSSKYAWNKPPNMTIRIIEIDVVDRPDLHELCDGRFGSKCCVLRKGHGGPMHVSNSGSMWSVGAS